MIVRTTWDYQRDADLFLSVLDEIEGQGVPLANPASVVRWNVRKTYLRDLAQRGVTIVPTRAGDTASRRPSFDACRSSSVRMSAW